MLLPLLLQLLRISPILDQAARPEGLIKKGSAVIRNKKSSLHLSLSLCSLSLSLSLLAMRTDASTHTSDFPSTYPYKEGACRYIDSSLHIVFRLNLLYPHFPGRGLKQNNNARRPLSVLRFKKETEKTEHGR